MPRLPEASTDRIVVAVDGSEASVRALVWALREASARRARVEALTSWPLPGAVFVREVAGHFCEPRWRARELQAATMARALARVDDAPPHDLRVVNADLGDALVDAAGEALLVVIGVDAPLDPPRPGTSYRRRLVGRLRGKLGDRLVVVGHDRTPEDPPQPLTGAQPTRTRSR